MTPSPDAARTEPRPARPARGLAQGLNALGILVVAFWFVRNGTVLHHPWWVWVVGALALAAWALREVSRGTRWSALAAVVMVLAGAAAVVPTQALMVAPLFVGIVVLGTDPRLPVWCGAVAALVAVVVIAVGATVGQVPVQFVLGTGAGALLGVLVAFSRRQLRVAQEQAHEAEREQQRAALLADRARAARDVHDVLAHSLGGLVLQLDAVEALLEAGRTDDAARRAGEARALAADGLAEARRAVHALRDDRADPVTAGGGVEPTRASRLADLLDAHRSFGGTVTTSGDLALPGLDAAHRDAVVLVVREALSNARRHAPGRPVDLSVVRDGSAVSVTVSNPLGTDGHGLVGMRERMAELGDASRVDAGVHDGSFVVAVRAVTT